MAKPLTLLARLRHQRGDDKGIVSLVNVYAVKVDFKALVILMNDGEELVALTDDKITEHITNLRSYQTWCGWQIEG